MPDPSELFADVYVKGYGVEVNEFPQILYSFFSTFFPKKIFYFSVHSHHLFLLFPPLKEYLFKKHLIVSFLIPEKNEALGHDLHILFGQSGKAPPPSPPHPHTPLLIVTIIV